MSPEVNCKQIIDLLRSDYMDNELDAPVRREVDRHLEHCPKCRKARADIEATLQPLRNASRLPTPAGLWPGIRNEIMTRQRAPKPHPAFNLHNIFARVAGNGWNAFALAAAAMLLITAIGLNLNADRQRNVDSTLTIQGLLGNEEPREFNFNFGSSIENYFL